jgi:D-amino peptidase
MQPAILVLVMALMLQAATKSIFLITDAEGVAGVCRQDQTDPKDAEMRQLLTGEINAAVAGFFEGGASDVIVWDGHDGSQTLSALTIDPRAHLVMGALPSTMLLERHYSAVAFVGQHARANTAGGVMAHSYSSLGIQTLLMNGRPVGEIETRAALAGWFHVPVVFLSGQKPAVIKTLRSDEVACTFVFNVPGAIGLISDQSLSLASCHEQVKVARARTLLMRFAGLQRRRTTMRRSSATAPQRAGALQPKVAMSTPV